MIAEGRRHRFGEASLSRVGLAINAVGLVMIAAIAFFPSSILLYTAVVVFTLGDGLFQPSINSLIANAAPHGMQGRVQGANQAQQSVARMLGPLLGALLYTLGPSIPYFAGSVLILIALATLFLPVAMIKESSLQGIDTA
jgi:MFS transporter, DHA1 family, tetracycline resistance protein